MKCPYCAFDESRVVDSRPCEDGTMIRRRRECAKCNKRFTTYERVENIPLIVVKKGGQRVPFDKNKIFNGMIKACEKRPVPIDAIKKVVDGYVVETYDRATLAAAQTPQVFNTELILQCMKKAISEGYTGTDDASLVEKYSDVKVKAVEGNYENIKITTPSDLK